MTFEELYARVEAATKAAKLGSDHLLPARICVGLCDLLEPNNSQRSGVEDAKLFLSGQIGDERRFESSARLAGELDKFHHRGDGKSREAAVQRLAWATLVTTEGMTPVMGEFLVGLGERAGLMADDVASVFVRLFPGFGNTA